MIDQVEPAKDTQGHPRYELLEYRFNLDEERVFERVFGDRLYGRIDLALRELIQNAVDATRYRVAYQLATADFRRKAKGGSKLDRLSRAIAARKNDLRLQVGLSRRVSTEGPEDGETYLIIEDHGIGMSRQVICDYLLKVGRSRWREDALVKEYETGAIGEFGIGFLSSFMIAERIVIETKSALPEEKAVKATVYSWKSYVATEPSLKRDVGTRIELKLKPEAVAALGERLEALDRWCPFLELPVSVSLLDGSEKTLFERNISKMPDSEQNFQPNRVFFPLNRSKNGSMGSLAKNGDGFAGERSLCQDGLTIPDVPPPLSYDPRQLALREAHVCIDLRGPDRFPLDLSRNLIRGESRNVWHKLTPKVWVGLLRSGAIRLDSVRSALANYVNLEFASFGRDARLVVGRDFMFRRLDSLTETRARTVGFVDSDDPVAAQKFGDLSTTWILLPNPEEVLESSYYRKKEIRKIRKERKVNASTFDPFQVEEFSEYSLVPGEKMMSLLFDAVLNTYAFASCWGPGPGTVFSRTTTEESVAIDTIGFLFPNDGWACVRAASAEDWIHVPGAYFTDLTIIAREKELSWEEYLFLLLFGVDSNYLAWRGWWLEKYREFDDIASKMADEYENLLEVSHESSLDPDEVDREELAFQSWSDSRANARPGSTLRDGYLKAEVNWFIENMLGNLDLDLFRRASTPWDREKWLAGQFMTIRRD